MSGTSRRSVLAGLAGGTLAAPAVLRAQPRHAWRMVTSWPRDLPGPGVSARRLAERIARTSGGRITVELFAAGEIVPAFEVMDAVGRGVAELGHSAAVFWTGKAEIAAFFTAVPFGLRPLEHLAWLEQAGGQELWDELYADFGVKPFVAGNTGMSMGGWFRRELRSAADLRGLKWRMPGLGGRMYRSLGVVQVSLPPGDILPALQSGTIDAAEFAAPASDLALGFHKVAPYYYWPGIHEPNGSSECLVNLAAWEALESDLREVVATACAAEHAHALAESERRNAAALRALVEDHGVRLRRFPDDILARARESARELLAGFAAGKGIAARIARSYGAMLETLGAWPTVSVRGFLEARDGP